MSSRRMPFNLNTIVLLPLLRAMPAAGGISVASTLVAMTGLDAGLMGLGHPETAADDLVAWMMSFSVAAPVLWGYYMIRHAWLWMDGVRRHRTGIPPQADSQVPPAA
ncbi:MAG: hypothetical protein AB7O28_22895 [Vicinamibacterales bacterium]